MDSRKFSEYFLLLEKIKLVVFDCDGVMTDGGIYINNKEESFRKFDVKDGVGVKLLQSKNIVFLYKKFFYHLLVKLKCKL